MRLGRDRRSRALRRASLGSECDYSSAADAFDDAVREPLVRVLLDAFQICANQLKLDRRAATVEY